MNVLENFLRPIAEGAGATTDKIGSTRAPDELIGDEGLANATQKNTRLICVTVLYGYLLRAHGISNF